MMIKPHPESNSSPSLDHGNAQASSFTESKAEFAKQEPGHEKGLGSSTEQPKNLLSRSFTDFVAHADENKETECEEPESSPQYLPSSPSLSTTYSCINEETTLNEDLEQGADRQQNAPSSSDPITHTNEKKGLVIKSIRVTDVALGLRRVPAGFHVVVHHNGLSWKTENKPSSVHDDVVEWEELIPLPSDLSVTICLEIYASFEFEPMLGFGEQLRKLTISVEQLLRRSAIQAREWVSFESFTLFPKDEDVVSPCSSIFIAVERPDCKEGDSSALEGLAPRCSSSESPGELEGATNQGHNALSRYRKYGGKQDLERSIEQFERALSICPLDHSCRAAAQSNLATVQFVRCRDKGRDTSLDVPLRLYRNALAARPAGHVDRPSTLIQLAAVHVARFEELKDEAEAARAEALLHEAIGLVPTDHHENRAAMVLLQLHAGRRTESIQPDDQLSVEQVPSLPFRDQDLHIFSFQLLRRFQRFGDLADLQQAIVVLEDLVRSTPIWDDWYYEALKNLGVALSYRFDNLGQLNDLEGAISRQRDALGLISRSYPLRGAHVNNLGDYLFIRFKRLGAPSDLMDAISLLREAVELTSHGHPDRSTYLGNLGTFLRARFERLGELSDLEDAILMLKEANNFTPHGHPEKPARLCSLGSCLRTRFERLGKLSDLDHAISSHNDAVYLTPHDHPSKPTYLDNLGSSFLARFGQLGELNDLGSAISTLRKAVELTPHHHPDKCGYLNNLSHSLFIRFERLGELSDLDLAISMCKDAIYLTPNDHPERAARLNNIGNLLSSRFERLGEPSDLENAISTLTNAIDLTPHDHPERPGHLNNLGTTLLTRFQHFGELIDLENGIYALRKAVDLTPHGHPEKPACLGNLGTSYKARFDRLGELDDIEEAVSRHMECVSLIPHGHPHEPGCLNNLGRSLFTRFGHLGELSDLENAISTHRKAVDLTPHGQPDKSAWLRNLGDCLRSRFARLGELTDIEEAISILTNVVNLTSHGHPQVPDRLSCLGDSLFTRFGRLGEPSDLEGAISVYKDAVDLTPRSHPEKPASLNSLGNSLRARFELRGQLSDLEDAILVHRSAVNHTPHSHPGKPAYLNNLGSSLITRFQFLGEVGDLKDAISKYWEAVDLTSHGHPQMAGRLSNLGSSFFARFNHLGELGDLHVAISRYMDAVKLTPHGHPDKLNRVNNLGNALVARFERLGELSDLDQAISLYSYAASSPIGPASARFHASQKWITCACRIHHHSLLRGHSVALRLLPQLAWIGLPLLHRYAQLATQGADVVREAAAAALESGLPETAVEWLEQGRSIVWGELLQLRGDFEELSSTHPDYAHRLRGLSIALENASATHEQSLSSLSENTENGARRQRDSLQQEANRHRALAIERDKLLQEIRCLPGFEHFLLHKQFSQLRGSARSGPVVILNAAENRCDALIVLAGVDHVIHVPLPKFSFKRCVGVQNMMESLLGHARVTPGDERKGDPAARGYGSWELLLSILWNDVVKLVLDALAFSSLGDLSRVFWCPTGPFVFLPIHAAGIYGIDHSQPGHKVSDFVISSYVPTLSILSLSSSGPSARPTSNSDFRLLAVRQPPSDGLSRLPGVDIELEHIRTVIRTSRFARTTLLESSVGTVEEVLSLMKDADWVHFACHGIQDTASPTDTGLCLADRRRLRLCDIVAFSRPRGGLAFLSACQTAMGEEHLTDEAIHLAAGMLFAGYGGVIGTMWSISDRFAPCVARDVYEQLFRTGTRPNYREAAQALHHAIARARESGASFVEWLPFIHVGL